VLRQKRQGSPFPQQQMELIAQLASNTGIDLAEEPGDAERDRVVDVENGRGFGIGHGVRTHIRGLEFVDWHYCRW
jgi:hypothetical protein